MRTALRRAGEEWRGWHEERSGNRALRITLRLASLVANTARCSYETVSQIEVPAAANFQDYSAINIRGDDVIISSQEDSAVWIGKLVNDAADFDPLTSRLAGDKVRFFPRDSSCEHIYCNIEGVAWLDDEAHRIVAVSDKMKARGKQPFRCQQKDQSIHIFALP